jgi:hypothetical protein
VHDGELGMKLLQDHLLEVTLFCTTAKLPSGTFKEETVDVSTRSSKFREFSSVLGVENSGLQQHLIKRKSVSTGSHLLNGSQVRHGIEKTRDPNNWGSDKLLLPCLKLYDTQEAIREPINKSLLGEVGNGLP